MARGIQLQFDSQVGRHAHRLWLNPSVSSDGLQIPTERSELSGYQLPVSDWRIPLAPRIGRFYPSRLQAPDFPATQFRIIHADDTTLTLDFNEPLSRFSPTLSNVMEHALADGILKPAQLLPWAGMEVPLPDTATDFADEGGFTREDETDDVVFYRQPRITAHIDSQCIARVESAYAQLIPDEAAVLDLMSSCHSHLPDTISAVGLGMNEEELRQNPALSAYHLHDLNRNPVLPFQDHAFDVVAISLSIEYLTDPASVLRDIQRVLKAGGKLIISFSHRYFPTKAIKLWTQIHPMERMQWVIQLLQQAGYHGIHSLVERGLPRPKDDRYADQFREADPLFLAWASTPSTLKG